MTVSILSNTASEINVCKPLMKLNCIIETYLYVAYLQQGGLFFIIVLTENRSPLSCSSIFFFKFKKQQHDLPRGNISKAKSQIQSLNLEQIDPYYYSSCT